MKVCSISAVYGFFPSQRMLGILIVLFLHLIGTNALAISPADGNVMINAPNSRNIQLQYASTTIATIDTNGITLPAAKVVIVERIKSLAGTHMNIESVAGSDIIFNTANGRSIISRYNSVEKLRVDTAGVHIPTTVTFDVNT